MWEFLVLYAEGRRNTTVGFFCFFVFFKLFFSLLYSFLCVVWYKARSAHILSRRQVYAQRAQEAAVVEQGTCNSHGYQNKPTECVPNFYSSATGCWKTTAAFLRGQQNEAFRGLIDKCDKKSYSLLVLVTEGAKLQIPHSSRGCMSVGLAVRSNSYTL